MELETTECVAEPMSKFCCIYIQEQLRSQVTGHMVTGPRKVYNNSIKMYAPQLESILK